MRKNPSFFRNLLNSNVSEQKTPSDNKFINYGDNVRDGVFSPRDEAVFRIYDKSVDKWKDCLGSEIKDMMMEDFGIDSVLYEDGEPGFMDFVSSFTAENFAEFLSDTSDFVDTAGHVYLDNMPTFRDGKGGTFDLANSHFSDLFGVSKSDIADFMDKNNLTWHECGDGHTIIMIPSYINQVFPHTGGIGLEKDFEAFSQRFHSIVGDGFTLADSPFKSGAETQNLNNAIDAAKKDTASIKHDLFGGGKTPLKNSTQDENLNKSSAKSNPKEDIGSVRDALKGKNNEENTAFSNGRIMPENVDNTTDTKPHQIEDENLNKPSAKSNPKEDIGSVKNALKGKNNEENTALPDDRIMSENVDNTTDTKPHQIEDENLNKSSAKSNPKEDIGSVKNALKGKNNEENTALPDGRITPEDMNNATEQNSDIEERQLLMDTEHKSNPVDDVAHVKDSLGIDDNKLSETNNETSDNTLKTGLDEELQSPSWDVINANPKEDIGNIKESLYGRENSYNNNDLIQNDFHNEEGFAGAKPNAENEFDSFDQNYVYGGAEKENGSSGMDSYDSSDSFGKFNSVNENNENGQAPGNDKSDGKSAFDNGSAADNSSESAESAGGNTTYNKTDADPANKNEFSSSMSL